VEGRERPRLFVALLLPDEAVARLAEWQGHEFADRRGLRVVPGENLHITLAFLGSRESGDVDPISEAVSASAATVEPIALLVRRYHETQRVGMLVLDDETPVRRSEFLARDVQDRLAEIGVYRPESRPWTPHITVVRFRERPRLAPRLPELGRVVSSEMAVMISRLRPSGAQYEVIESVPLGG
jgi:RNA 2',3'-cyclic 3'-phosphodiesterase